MNLFDIFFKKKTQEVELRLSDVSMYVLQPNYDIASSFAYGMFKIASGALDAQPSFQICNVCGRSRRIKKNITYIDYYTRQKSADEMGGFIQGDSSENIVTESLKNFIENSDLVGIEFSPVIIKNIDQEPVNEKSILPKLYRMDAINAVSVAKSARLQLTSSCTTCGITTYKVTGPEQMIPFLEDIKNADFFSIKESGMFLISEKFKQVLAKGGFKNYTLHAVPTVL